MKKQLLTKAMLLLCTLVVGSGSVWADEATFDWTASGNMTAATGKVNAITLTGAKNSASGVPAVTSNTLRLYAHRSSGDGASATFTADEGCKITAIAVTSSNGGTILKYATDGGSTYTGFSFSSGSATVKDLDASSITLKNCQSSGSSNTTIQIAKVVITYTPAAVKVSSITLDKTTLSLAVDENAKLSATVLPDNATDKTVTWDSSDDTVAEVDNTGTVTAKAVGNATITATANDGSGKTATCAVTVTAARIDVTSVSLNKSTLELYAGDTETLTATVLPDDATNKAVTWESSDDAVATVDNNGLVTAVAVGTATITVTTEDGGKTATCDVTVSPVAVTGVTLNKTETTITFGGTETLVANVTPINATNKSVTWESSNPRVATVADGEVTAVAVGTATITVTTADGSKTATCDVTVNANEAQPALTEVIFKETFDKCNSTGGNDGTWAGNVGTDWKADDGDNTWSMTKGYAASKCVKMGTGSALGKATTPALALKSGKTYKLSFRAGAFSGKSTNLKVSMTNGTLSASSVTMQNAAFDDYELTITNASADAKITFEGNATNNSQFFLDEVVITTTSSTVDVTLNANGFASYCSPFALDLTPTADYAAYAVKPIGDNKVKFTKIAGKVAKQTPVILYSTTVQSDKVSLPIIADDDAGINAVSDNALVGTLSPTYTEAPAGYTNFGMSGSKFVPMTAGVVKANKAYLQVSDADITTGSGARNLEIVFDDGETTGISDATRLTENGEMTKDKTFFNLNGQRVSSDHKGIVIVNGKKVVLQ